MNHSVFKVCNDALFQDNQYTFKSFDEVLFDYLNDAGVGVIDELDKEKNKEKGNGKDKEKGNGEDKDKEKEKTDSSRRLIPLPVPVREGELEKDSIDLTVLHYYLSKEILEKYPFLINKFDETSLLMIRMCIEQWIEEYLVKDEELEDVERDRQGYLDIEAMNVFAEEQRRSASVGKVSNEQAEKKKKKKKSKEKRVSKPKKIKASQSRKGTDDLFY
ncbi:hypothetical protein ACO0QE_002873 [Hanseniaspora vineae]